MKGKVGGQWNKIFRSMLITWFLSFFSGVLDWIVLILVWFERSLHSKQVSRQSCPWPLKLMTPQRVERTWICTGGSGANGLSCMFCKLQRNFGFFCSVNHLYTHSKRSYLQSVYLNICHFYEGQLTAVKLEHPLTIIAWLYCGLISIHCEVDHTFVLSFSLLFYLIRGSILYF